MIWLTGLDMSSSYATDILPPLIVAGLGLGMVMAPAMSLAAEGVAAEDSGAASAAVNTMQQVGGSLGTALLNTLFSSAVTDYLDGKDPKDPAVLAQAGLEGYSTAYRRSAVFFIAGLVISVILYWRGVPSTDPGRGARGAHVRLGRPANPPSEGDAAGRLDGVSDTVARLTAPWPTSYAPSGGAGR